MALQRLKLQSARMRRERGAEEIERRVKAMQDGWRSEQELWREYRREVKSARKRKQKLPPNSYRNPGVWLQWKQTHDYLCYQGREPWQ
jgi:hypothetical protein